MKKLSCERQSLQNCFSANKQNFPPMTTVEEKIIFVIALLKNFAIVELHIFLETGNNLIDSDYTAFPLYSRNQNIQLH